MITREFFHAFRPLRALVVGDICLDRWCSYDPSLADASRETGLDRIAVVSEECTPGGGGTVANNLAAFGLARVAVLGVVGDDGRGFDLLRALDARQVDMRLMLRSPMVSTFTYTKLLNARTGIEDLPRVDYIQANPIPASLERQVSARLLDVHEEFDVILVADQAETEVGGVVTEALRRTLTEIARKNPEQVIWVDSRSRCELFRGVTMKVNRAEADAACLRAFGEVNYDRLRRYLCAGRLFVTDGPNDTRVCESGKLTLAPATRVAEPVDICGAGDSFSAGAACALSLGATGEDAARVGGMVSAITIMKRGTGTASLEELEKCLPPDAASASRADGAQSSAVGRS